MNPKKVKTLIKETADNLDIPEGYAKDAISFFWQELRRDLSSLNNPKIFVKGLGTFQTRYDRVKDAIKDYQRFVDNYQPKTFRQHGMINHKKNRLQKLIEIQKFMEEEYQREKDLKMSKEGGLIKVWKNKGKILEGIKNKIFKQDHIEEIATARMEICNSCDLIDREGGSCTLPGSQPCCSACGCCLSLKTRSLSSACDKGKWEAVVSEEEADAIVDVINENQTNDEKA